MPKAPKPLVRSVRMEGGKLYLSDGTEHGENRARKLLAAALKHLPDGAYDWEIRPFAQTRSLKANAWLWGVCYKLIAEETGHSPEEIHELMRLRHNSKRIAHPETGEEIQVPVSTTKLTIEEFSVYIDRVMLDGAEWCGIMWPEPRPSEDWRTPAKRTRAA